MNKYYKNYFDYIKDPLENGVHAATIGYKYGLKPGQQYPGKEKALKTLEDISNKYYEMRAYD